MMKRLMCDYNKDGYYDPPETFFSASVAKDQTYDAYDQWLNICDPKDNYHCEPCDLHIKWERDPLYFKDHPDCLSLYQFSYNQADCSSNCTLDVIYINITQDVIGWDPPADKYGSFPKKRFFYTNPNHKYAFDNMGNSVLLYSYKTVILHEIGHWLGFAHQDRWNCGDPNGIMSCNGEIGELNNATEWNISEDDKCMFMKIYCCPGEHTGVNEDDKNKDNYVMIIKPNPTKTELNIQFNLEKPQSVNLAIYNLLSEKLISIINDEFLVENSYNYNVNLNGLPSGTYLCILKIDGQNIAKQFVITR